MLLTEFNAWVNQSCKALQISNIKRQSVLVNEDSNGKVWRFWLKFFSSPDTVLFPGDVKSKKVCFAFEELGFDSMVIMSLFQSCWAVLNCAFQLSFFLSIGTQALIVIFFCQKILPTISAYTQVKQHAVTVTSNKQHTTLLALTPLLWTQASEHPCKSSAWLLLSHQRVNNFRVLYQNLYVIGHFSYFSWLVFQN